MVNRLFGTAGLKPNFASLFLNKPLKLDYPFKVAYVVTSNGADIYADMVLVSMLSVQISNPILQVVVVCDEQSAIAIKASKHRLIDVCDEFISVKTPDGEPTFRNRWIKTQLCNFIPGQIAEK
jgi:hypothetical protein